MEGQYTDSEQARRVIAEAVKGIVAFECNPIVYCQAMPGDLKEKQVLVSITVIDPDLAP